MTMALGHTVIPLRGQEVDGLPMTTAPGHTVRLYLHQAVDITPTIMVLADMERSVDNPMVVSKSTSLAGSSRSSLAYCASGCVGHAAGRTTTMLRGGGGTRLP